MEIKEDILSRAYLSFFIVIGICLFIIGRAAYVQQYEGKKWKSLNDKYHITNEEVEAERGTIYSEDGRMLSTSIPKFDIYIDFCAAGLRSQKGAFFKKHLDSLSYCLSELFGDSSQNQYKKILLKKFNENIDRNYLLHKSISYFEYQKLKTFPIFRLGRSKSGMYVDVKSKRFNPYGMLAFRTIGLSRDSNKVGLELSYDTLLKGKSGTRTVRYIAGGVAIPVDESAEVETENGKDIVTTIDVLIQEITENALLDMMYKNQAHQGCSIVMETKTGKIKAIANLGLDSNTIKYKTNYELKDYFEIKNYALLKSEPGSTFKLATLIALLDDKKINLNTPVNLEDGTWHFADKATVKDADGHKGGIVTAQEAFEASSNVGMAKMAWNGYSNNPTAFVKKLHQYRMDTASGIELIGESNPDVYQPGKKGWDHTTLPWMAHGYNVSVTPMQTLTLYNAIANNGKMMKPYLVSAVSNEGVIIKEFKPTTLREKICSDTAFAAVKKCLIGVCHSPSGTAKSLFADNTFLVGGKTGTSYYVGGGIKYTDFIYQSSFAGFFPADNPQYSCIVVIVNKPNPVLHFGAAVAGPVFKEIANRIYTSYVKNTNSVQSQLTKIDSATIHFSGYNDDIKYVLKKINLKYSESSSLADDWVNVQGSVKAATVSTKKMKDKSMPSLKGMNIKDAVYLCETMGMKVSVTGRGKVNNQSISEGSKIVFGQHINIDLN
jgi:cell division protein FtsI (penicillin-binding protein 3)